MDMQEPNDILSIHLSSLCADSSRDYWYDSNAFVEEDDLLWFPDPRMGKGDGTRCPLCVGGNLSPECLELAYSYGIFPWYDFRFSIPQWYGPTRRFVLFPDKVHISHSMRTLLNKNRYGVTFNESLPEVATNCSTVDGRSQLPGAWLGPELISSLVRLWEKGVVKSVEVRDTWEDNRLVGGLYGYWINGCFLGDSMFSLVPSASKIALIGLCRQMKEFGGRMIDLQIRTPHLEAMGGEYMGYHDFLQLLNPEAAANISPDFERPFQIEWEQGSDENLCAKVFISDPDPKLLFIAG